MLYNTHTIVLVSILGCFVFLIVSLYLWRHSAFYKKNFPVDSISLQLLSEKDRLKLYKWASSFIFENKVREKRIRMHVCLHGDYPYFFKEGYSTHEIYEKIINSLSLSIKENRVISSEGELFILNLIIHSHKYNALVSRIVFPRVESAAHLKKEIQNRKEVKHGL